MNETAFRDFQHIRCLHLEHTCTNAADVVRCRRTRVVRASKQRYVKIEEGGLFHFRTFIQLCNSNFYFATKLKYLLQIFQLYGCKSIKIWKNKNQTCILCFQRSKGGLPPLFPLSLILEYFTQERYISRKVEQSR